MNTRFVEEEKKNRVKQNQRKDSSSKKGASKGGLQEPDIQDVIPPFHALIHSRFETYERVHPDKGLCWEDTANAISDFVEFSRVAIMSKKEVRRRAREKYLREKLKAQIEAAMNADKDDW